MSNTVKPEIDVDELMRRIREEVAARKGQLPPTQLASGAARSIPNTQAVLALPRLPESTNCVATKSEYTLAELLAYDDELFMRSAYRAILQREPDAVGQAHYLEALRTGVLTKAEILGRLRYSPEGKQRHATVQGLLLSFVVQSAYHIPVLGYGIALASFLLRLPIVVRNWANFQAHTLRHQQEQVRHINALVAQVEGALGKIKLSAGFDESRAAQQLQHLSEILETKALASQLEALGSDTQEKFMEMNRAIEARAATAHAELTEVITRISNEVQEKACSKHRVALQSELMAFQASTVPLHEIAPLQQSVRDLSSRVEAAIHHSLETALAQKASNTQVETVATQVGDKLQSIVKAIEDKADNERLTQLTNHLVDMVQRKADSTELASTANSLSEQIAQKANLSQLESMGAHTAQKLASLTESITQKLDAASILPEIGEIQRRVADHKRNILDQQRRLTMLLEEARKRLPAPISTEQIENMVKEEDHLLDAFYVSFEDHFRGTREDIKQRVAVYLPIVKEANAGTVDAPILDIGCGRGEWLELLKDNHLIAHGIDLNRIMVSQCLELDLNVIEADAISHLRKLKSNSIGAITGMHIIEHIPFRSLIILFDEVFRVLMPGGVAIFETPNPENLVVGACNFYYDPTHLHPLPPEPMRFVMEARGFGHIDIMRLHPNSQLAHHSDLLTSTDKIVSDLLFGAQDYSLVAFKN